MEVGIRDERTEKFNQLVKQQERLEEKLRMVAAKRICLFLNLKSVTPA